MKSLNKVILLHSLESNLEIKYKLFISIFKRFNLLKSPLVSGII